MLCALSGTMVRLGTGAGKGISMACSGVGTPEHSPYPIKSQSSNTNWSAYGTIVPYCRDRP